MAEDLDADLNVEGGSNGEEVAEVTVEEFIAAFRDELDPEEDIPFIEEIDLDADEMLGFMAGILLQKGFEDPEAEMLKRGLITRYSENPEEVRRIQQDRKAETGQGFKTDEVDEIIRRKLAAGEME